MLADPDLSAAAGRGSPSECRGESCRDKLDKEGPVWSSGGERALPDILPLSHDPVDDSDNFERLPRFGAWRGLLEVGIGRGRREAPVGDCDIVSIDDTIGVCFR